MARKFLYTLLIAMPTFVGGQVRAGEVVINNLSNDLVDVAVVLEGVGKDQLVSYGYLVLKTNDKPTITFAGDVVWLRVQRKGAQVNYPNHNTKLNYPVSDRTGFNVLTTENPAVYTLKWTKPGDNRDTPFNWRTNQALPEGWSKREFFKARAGDSFQINP